MNDIDLPIDKSELESIIAAIVSQTSVAESELNSSVSQLSKKYNIPDFAERGKDEMYYSSKGEGGRVIEKISAAEGNKRALKRHLVFTYLEELLGIKGLEQKTYEFINQKNVNEEPGIIKTALNLCTEDNLNQKIIDLLKKICDEETLNITDAVELGVDKTDSPTLYQALEKTSDSYEERQDELEYIELIFYSGAKSHYRHTIKRLEEKGFKPIIIKSLEELEEYEDKYKVLLTNSNHILEIADTLLNLDNTFLVAVNPEDIEISLERKIALHSDFVVPIKKQLTTAYIARAVNRGIETLRARQDALKTEQTSRENDELIEKSRSILNELKGKKGIEKEKTMLEKEVEKLGAGAQSIKDMLLSLEEGEELSEKDNRRQVYIRALPGLKEVVERHISLTENPEEALRYCLNYLNIYGVSKYVNYLLKLHTNDRYTRVTFKPFDSRATHGMFGIKAFGREWMVKRYEKGKEDNKEAEQTAYKELSKLFEKSREVKTKTRHIYRVIRDNKIELFTISPKKGETWNKKVIDDFTYQEVCYYLHVPRNILIPGRFNIKNDADLENHLITEYIGSREENFTALNLSKQLGDNDFARQLRLLIKFRENEFIALLQKLNIELPENLQVSIEKEMKESLDTIINYFNTPEETLFTQEDKILIDFCTTEFAKLSSIFYGTARDSSWKNMMFRKTEIDRNKKIDTVKKLKNYFNNIYHNIGFNALRGEVNQNLVQLDFDKVYKITSTLEDSRRISLPEKDQEIADYHLALQQIRFEALENLKNTKTDEEADKYHKMVLDAELLGKKLEGLNLKGHHENIFDWSEYAVKLNKAKKFVHKCGLYPYKTPEEMNENLDLISTIYRKLKSDKHTVTKKIQSEQDKAIYEPALIKDLDEVKSALKRRLTREKEKIISSQRAPKYSKLFNMDEGDSEQNLETRAKQLKYSMNQCTNKLRKWLTNAEKPHYKKILTYKILEYACDKMLNNLRSSK